MVCATADFSAPSSLTKLINVQVLAIHSGKLTILFNHLFPQNIGKISRKVTEEQTSKTLNVT